MRLLLLITIIIADIIHIKWLFYYQIIKSKLRILVKRRILVTISISLTVVSSPPDFPRFLKGALSHNVCDV